MDIDESQIVRAVILLSERIDGYIELRGRSKAGGIDQSFFRTGRHSVEEIIATAKDYNSRGNVWIGRAIRATPSGSGSDISYIRWVSFDFDAIRPQGTIASNDELKLTREAAISIQAAAETRGWVVMTGNGHQVWMRISDPIDVRCRQDAISAGIAAWSRRMIQSANIPPGVQVDPQHDTPRVIKLPGTWSTKGTPNEAEGRVYRLAHFEDGMTLEAAPEIDSEMLINLSAVEGTIHEAAVINRAVVPARFWALLSADAKLREAWLGERRDLPSGRESQSEQDMSLVSRLKQLKFSKEEAKGVLMASPKSKAASREDYADLTIVKVFGG